MKQHILMGVAILLILLSACATGPSKDDIEREQGVLQNLRDCGKSEGYTLVSGYYECTFANCRLTICWAKRCQGEEREAIEQVLDLKEVHMDSARCEIVYEKKEN